MCDSNNKIEKYVRLFMSVRTYCIFQFGGFMRQINGPGNGPDMDNIHNAIERRMKKMQDNVAWLRQKE